MSENEIARTVMNLGLKVHKNLGPGLLENSYLECLYYEIRKAGLKVEKQVPLPLVYEHVKLDIGYRVDLVVEEKFIIELKSVEALHPLHTAQIITYLKLSGYKLGYLINFNTLLFKDGIQRIINGTL
jgi:GxxExxY protein